MGKKSDQKICPIIELLSFISKKWTLMTLRAINDGAHCYSEIEAKLPGVNPGILSQRLKDIQQFGFVEKQIISKTPLKAEYHLTQRGQEFSKMIDQMAHWAIK